MSDTTKTIELPSWWKGTELQGSGMVIAVAIFIGVLTLAVLISTGSILAVLFLWTFIAVVLIVLSYFGFIDIVAIIDELLGTKEKPKTTETAPAQTAKVPGFTGSEVFHIDDNKFTYDEAPAVCAAYGASLATLEQIIEAYNGGAEWCGYGWSAGGLALYPTQKSTWDELQREVDLKKRTACGRPGVNGGYFDPMTKFGVNCFGFKPAGNIQLPTPVPGTDKTQFNKMVNEFKSMIKSFNMSPWSRKEWSTYDETRNYGSQFAQQSTAPTEQAHEGFDNPYYEAVSSQSSSAYTAAPYGLMGSQGPQGPAGPAGPASTVPGPAGPMGPTGPAGPQGSEGAASTVPGPTGPTGKDGNNGPTGPTGPTGPKSIPQILWATIGAPTKPDATGVKSPEQVDVTRWAKQALNPANNYDPPCDTDWWFGKGNKPAGMGSPIVCDTVYSISGDPANKKISRVGNFQDKLVRRAEIPFT